MKRFILTIICAALFVLSGNAQTVKTTEKYIIDGKEITNFDGSQLKHKVILDYKIEPDIECFVHRITTSDSLKNMKMNLEGWKIEIPEILDKGANKGKHNFAFVKHKLLYIVDGVVKKDGLKGIEPLDITSVTVHKPGTKVAKSYGEAGKYGVVVIKTRKEKRIVYIVNGKKVTGVDVQNFSPDQIKSVVISKKGSKAAVAIGGQKEGNQCDYISIELK